jgi:hypothetical protein
MRWLANLWGCLLLSALAAGCASKLDIDHKVSLRGGEIKRVIIDPPTRDQKVTVHAKSPGAPVSVYCCLEKDKDAVESAVERRRPSDKILSSKERIEDGELEFNLPAGASGAVVLTTATAKSANVELKITGQ